MIKVAFFSGQSAAGPTVIPLFGKADAAFEKTAAPVLLPEVVRYIEGLRPRPDAQYVLVNALGAVEWWGSNVNGDAFTEASLIHAPDNWSHNPLVDKVHSKTWAYGYPTFYYAHAFAHHRNSDATKAFGDVELAAWNSHMKRVELVVRVDKERCEKFNGVGVWDKLKAGEYPAVSMGCKVPFDTCSICLDWKLYREGMSTFDPHRHKHPGEAILAFHKKLQAQNGKGIRGLSITRKDYCEHAKGMMNKILSDGRKVFVWNDFPRFFDISFVFIGADKTAYQMMKIAGDGQKFFGGAELAEKLGYTEEVQPAAPTGDMLKVAFIGKRAKNKASEIVKDVMPSQFASRAVPVMTKSEPDLPKELLDMLGKSPLESSLATTAGMGVILRPREFQRIVLIESGHMGLADALDERGAIFPKSPEVDPVKMSPEKFHPSLARLLLPFLAARSMLGPYIESRATLPPSSPALEKKSCSSLSLDLLHKIASAYNGYRNGVMTLVANAQNLIAGAAFAGDSDLHKLASLPVEAVFTPLSITYVREAFLDELIG